MNISRNFLLIGVVWIIAGMILGSWMGATNDHTLMPLHAHMNLLGFVLPAVFALTYRSWPAVGQSRLATLHFWMHTAGAVILMGLLYLLFTGRVTGESPLAILAPVSEALIIVGVALFGWNLVQNAA